MDSRTVFNETHYEVKKLGEGAYADVYLSISRSDANRIRAKYEKTDRPQMYKALRQQLVAVKIAKLIWDDDSLATEIHVLTNLLPGKHERIIDAVGSMSERPVQWLKTPYISGGDLHGFSERCPNGVTESFMYHVACQGAEALAFLLSGATQANNMTPMQSWSCVSHGDIHPGNWFLRLAGTFGNFPDVVLADFGRAEFGMSEERAISRSMRDADDVAECILLVTKRAATLDRATCERLRDLWKPVRAVDQAHAVNRMGLLAAYKKVMTSADRVRRSRYQALPEGLLALLRLNKVSESELDDAFWDWVVVDEDVPD
ncbi:hypothetical protein B0A50_07278 [Salinomyces thailandicus]|uniref:non-specific serine/threonine protein kinase n=1 Tax=Salinomyces thailandicus TaxID=706561 RepID=A0A4U0TNP5_9PEZI|nr:hypothetical protein B0A50_07278 [Salinomyces thailandica]